MNRLGKICAAGVLFIAAVGCDNPSVEVGDPFQVIHSAPQHGGSAIATDVMPSIGFSDPVNPTSVHGVSLQQRDAAGFDLISVTTFIESDGFLVALLPNDFLLPETTYQIVASTELRSASDEPLLTRYRAEFITAAE